MQLEEPANSSLGPRTVSLVAPRLIRTVLHVLTTAVVATLYTLPVVPLFLTNTISTRYPPMGQSTGFNEPDSPNSSPLYFNLQLV